MEEIVSLSKSMGLDKDEDDINDLIGEHTEEMTTKELKELQTQQHMKVLQEIGGAEKAEEILGRWEKLFQLYSRETPRKMLQTGLGTALFNDTCLTHFRYITKERMKQTSLDRVLSKTLENESGENVAERGKNQRIRFSFSVQPFSFTSVSICKSYDPQGKCCTSYLIKPVFIQYPLFACTFFVFQNM